MIFSDEPNLNFAVPAELILKMSPTNAVSRKAPLLSARTVEGQTVQGKANGLPLSNVGKVTLDVVIEAEELPFGVTEQRLRTMTELRLRAAGIKILSERDDEQDPDINPSVELLMTILTTGSQAGSRTGYAFSTVLSVREYRISPRNSALAPLELWSQAQLNLTPLPAATAAMERVVGRLLDSMINDWLKANR